MLISSSLHVSFSDWSRSAEDYNDRSDISHTQKNIETFNLLNPQDASKHHFASVKNDVIF